MPPRNIRGGIAVLLSLIHISFRINPGIGTELRIKDICVEWWLLLGWAGIKYLLQVVSAFYAVPLRVGVDRAAVAAHNRVFVVAAQRGMPLVGCAVLTGVYAPSLLVPARTVRCV